MREEISVMSAKALRSAASAVFVLFIFLFGLSDTAAAAAYAEKNVEVTHDGQVVDSFYGVDARYILDESDTGDYCCAEYVSRFYREKFGVTVYNINTQDAKPDVYVYGKDAELREVETPRAGDIMQDKDYCHVAVVKDCSENEVTVIEQNYKWTVRKSEDESTVCTVVNRKLIKSAHYYYRLYINGTAQSLVNNSQIKLSASSITVAKGSSRTITAAVTGTDAGERITWKSADSSIASVSNGKITGKSAGTVKIMAATGGGKTAYCTVKVTAPISGASVGSIPDRVYNGSAQSPSVKVTFGGKTLVKGTDYTLSYENNKGVGRASVIIKGKGCYTGSKTVSFVIVPGDVSSLSTQRVTDVSVKLDWNAARGAGGYEIYRYNSALARWDKISDTSVTYYTDNGLKSATVCKYKVRAYRVVQGKTYYGDMTGQLVCKTLPGKTVCKASSPKSGSITVSWTKLNGVSGYEIFISNTGVEGSYTKLADVKDKLSCTCGGVGSTCLRFVKVRGYYYSGGKAVLGSFSQPVMVMIR